MRVGYLEGESSNAGDDLPSQSALSAAAKRDLVDLVEAVARGTGRRSIALEHHVQIVVA